MSNENKNFIDLDALYNSAQKEAAKNSSSKNNSGIDLKLPEFKIPKFKLPKFEIPKFRMPEFNLQGFKLKKKAKSTRSKSSNNTPILTTITSIIVIVLFISMLLGPNIAWKAIGKWGSEDYNRENRGFAPFPVINKENYLNIAKGLEDWLSDHTPFRKFFLELYASANRYLFEGADSQRVMFGKDGFVFFKINEDSIVDTLGIHPYTEEQMAKILAKMLKVRELYARHKDDYVLFIAPNKEVVYNDKLFPAFRKKDEASTAKRLVKYIRDHSDIKVVYPLGELQAGRKIMDTYYKTDDHWNAYGAYIGAGELIEAITGDKTDYSYFETIPETDEPLLTDLLDMISMPKDYDRSENFALKNYSSYDTKSTWIYRTNPKFVVGIDCSLMEDPEDDRSVTIIRDSFTIKMMYVLSQYFKNVNYIHYGSLDADTQTGSSIFHSDIFIHEFVERSLWRIEKDLDQLIENGERYFGEDDSENSYTKIIKGESKSTALDDAIRDVKEYKFVKNSTVRKVKNEEAVFEGPYSPDDLPYDPVLYEEVFVPVDVKRDDTSKLQKEIEDKLSGYIEETEEEILEDIELDPQIENVIDEIAHSNKKAADIMRKIAIKTKKSLEDNQP